MRDVIGAMNAHLGGEENISEPQRMLIRRTAAFEAELVHLEVGFAQARAAGEAPSANSLDLYSRMASASAAHPRGLRLASRCSRRDARSQAIP